MNVISTTDATYRPRDEAASLAATDGDESTPAGPAVADGDPTAVAAPGAPHAAQPSRLPLLLAIAAALIAAFAATVSAVGLAAASRTIAEARLAIQELRSTGTATPAAAQATPVAQAADPRAPAATVEDVREIVGTLRADLARYLAARDRAGAGAAPATAALRDGQVEIANRLGAIEIRLGRLEKGPLSASR